MLLGTHTVTLTVTDEMGLECQAQIQHKIGFATDLAPRGRGRPDMLVEDDAHAAEDLEVLWESSLDGSLDPDPIDSEGLSQLSLGTHVITAIATNPDDLSGTASLTLTVNGVPEAPSVVILPDPSTTTNDLTAVVTEGPTLRAMPRPSCTSGPKTVCWTAASLARSCRTPPPPRARSGRFE